jgi:hypothetical protein
MLDSTEQSLHSRPSLPLFAIIAHGMLGLALLGLAGFALNHFPVARVWLGVALVGYAGALWWQPRIWMLVVPALAPVLDLAPWTGWFFFDESDLFLAVTVAVGYLRTTGTQMPQRLHPAFGLLLGLLSLSYAISAYIGLVPLPPIDANAFSNYYSHFNSLRTLKGFLWALLLLPLLRRGIFDHNRLDPYLIAGMATGFAGVTLAALWERWAFTGLLDFASDYRITATFSAMHTGGAALDGYLAMALPFTALLIFRPKNAWVQGLGLALFIMGLYVSLVTFSRGLYLALVFIALMMCVPQLAAITSGPRRNVWVMLIRAVYLAMIAFLLWRLFSTGGYRTLAAILGLFGAAFFLGTGVSLHRNKPLLLIALTVFAAGGALLAQTIEKGAYVIFAAAAALFLIALPLTFSTRENFRHAGGALIAAFYLGMAAGVLLIAKHWGGNAALSDAVWPVLLAFALPVLNRSMIPRLWQRSRTNFAAFLVIGGLLGVSIPVAGNYYMKERMTQAQGDLSGRLAHWHAIYSMIEPDWQSQLFGMGLGRVPVNYFWKNLQHEFPGTYQYVSEAGNTFLRLGGPQYSAGYGEIIRIGQRLALYPHQKYTVEFDVRSNFTGVSVGAEFCEKLLLYPVDCVGTGANVGDTKGGWRKIVLNVDSKRLGDTPWYSRRPVQFSLSTSTPKAFVDIDNVRVSDAYGNDLLENGDFSAANSHWFFTSDRHHLPWHAKNLWLHVLFEQGWVGLILFCCLIIIGVGRTTANAFRGSVEGAVLSASLCGFLVVGLFDSLLDVPRSTLMFFLLLMLSGLIRAKESTEGKKKADGCERRMRGKTRQRSSTTASLTGEPSCDAGCSGLQGVIA